MRLEHERAIVKKCNEVSKSSISPGNATTRGLYVYGGVGCGKTMVMDQFYDNVDSKAKLRTHFHDFMLDVHERIHEYKSSLSPLQLRQVGIKFVIVIDL